MPCGGIYPVKGTPFAEFVTPEMPCWFCDKGDCDCFCDEWDAVIHSGCVEAFLFTDEGKVILRHKHPVSILENGAVVVLFGEGHEPLSETT